MSGRTVEVKLRLPVDLHAVVVARAQASGASRSQVIISMIRDGIAAGGPGREPATRDDLAALRDQVAALGEFQRAQSFALIEGVRGAIESMPAPVLPAGVPELEARRMAEEARAEAEAARAAEVERLQELLADERELSHSLGEQVKALRCELETERGRVADEIERRRGEIGFDGYMRGLEDCRKANPVKRLLGRF